jgi:ketosteroid isomerase-like protein
LIVLLTSFRSSERDLPALNTLIDNWHKAAASADLDGYFEPTTADFVFLGTDPEERWTKAEFQAFCKPYFADGKGWDFKSTERNWVFSKNGKIAWFDEKLDTWMEECRGSGVVVKEGKKWKLAYYNLTVLIENDKIKSFIELRKQ